MVGYNSDRLLNCLNKGWINNMIKKRLVQIVPDSKKYIAGNVLFQWIALISNIVFMTMITSFIATLAVTKDTGDLKQRILQLAAVLAVCFLIRFICNIFSARMSYKSFLPKIYCI